MDNATLYCLRGGLVSLYSEKKEVAEGDFHSLFLFSFPLPASALFVFFLFPICVGQMVVGENALYCLIACVHLVYFLLVCVLLSNSS